MISAGFEKLVVEDFCEIATRTLKRCIEKTHDLTTLQILFQEEEQSNYLVMFLRFLTSATIQNQRDLFSAYIDEALTVELFCRMEVEPLDVEADNVRQKSDHLGSNYGRF